MTITDQLIFKCLLKKIICTTKRKCIDSFITKNKKTEKINNMQCLQKTWLQHSHNQLVIDPFEPREDIPPGKGTRLQFLDKNKHTKKNIAARMESVAEELDKDLDN